MRRILLLAIVAALQAAQAQEWPARPVRIIVPFPPGGSADLVPRAISEKLAARWGQPVLIENRAGAAGNIGAEAVYKAEPDGYTLLAAPPPPLVINAALYPKLAYDAAAFVPVTVIAAIPNALLVHPRVGVNTIQELIAYARANPAKLNYASQGSGTTSHLTAELFKSMAGGLRITHVPYKGSAPALIDLLGGQVDMMCDNLGVSLPHVRSGKLKLLGVGSEKRVASLPEVPALAEVLPGFAAVAWFGIVAPPRTPAAITERIAAAAAAALKQPDVARRLVELSAEPVGSTPVEMAGFMRQERERWAAVIRAAGVKLD